MTVAQMQTLTAQLLGDTNNNKWDATTAILPALNIAQMAFVHKMIGYSAQTENVFDVLTEIQTSTEKSVDTTGYDLDNLATSPGPFISGGYVASKILVDAKEKWAARIPFKNLPQQNNRYLEGNSEKPVVYIFTNTFYVLVTAGSYPVTATIFYLREPKELVASGASGYQVATCELNTIHHRLISKMAAAECHRMAGDTPNISKYMALTRENDLEIQQIALGNAVEPKAETTEAWRKDVP